MCVQAPRNCQHGGGDAFPVAVYRIEWHVAVLSFLSTQLLLPVLCDPLRGISFSPGCVASKIFFHFDCTAAGMLLVVQWLPLVTCTIPFPTASLSQLSGWWSSPPLVTCKRCFCHSTLSSLCSSVLPHLHPRRTFETPVGGGSCMFRYTNRFVNTRVHLFTNMTLTCISCWERTSSSGEWKDTLSVGRFASHEGTRWLSAPCSYLFFRL
ncbi:T. brucei spp.-specific protein [Trypanosoma brucei gambiense DAL972]|uniref:T. brucei spp.-specific protein n=1 Tax=Trypanosoma brucei gambiense (strain MHOM/CI/86/DAL972) TaxID=679716 RepID=D0A7L7_TRYB9|nr:T. brucei spp.-specific protein [Trypanosoma brucei gambiense DAL972]CBH17668.1 T. brucei spp.-specific protein [Trypanosoma brucei gambiense DAL972]|eukprot:XP_011779932.1 T. brucei spp.-specific protein [Trypanosoma brucei gambiense DAL972]